jgi:hypothetical protein
MKKNSKNYDHSQQDKHKTKEALYVGFGIPARNEIADL